MKNKSRAFTLIELLVVVLIVGILAAIALPQYQIAVGKARFMELIVKGDVIRKAQEAYYLENGTYSTDMDKLATPVLRGEHTINLGDCYVELKYKNLPLHYIVYFANAPTVFSNRRECRIDKADLSKTNKQICASLTGHEELAGPDYSMWIF